ncbi:hypothetical protein DFQ28_000102 [Apophysomyces sp. BC1034]|nr:hypothetical protein DFQ29_008592 [Apophysomyces sp. BC1021]KAG0194404.1 hypothetical protein DFQ28_000102 [Apophysomyces sp. BC1034]
MARDGFKVPKLLEKTLEEHWEWMSKEPVWVGTYGVQDKNGRHHHAKFGDTLRRPRLAHSLELIAQHGAKIYYDGIIGEALVNATDAAGGILTRDDLRSYRAVIRSTVNTYYHGRKITTCTLPSSGPVLLSVLNMMERFNFKAEENKDLNVHRLIEGLKFGYALRTELGDPDFIDIGSRLDEIMSKEYSSDIRRNISDETTFPPLYYGPKYDKIENHGTMHISVVDKDDGAVALTTTVNLGFGSRLMDPVTGIILNNEMDDFSIPGQPNAFDLYPSKMNYIAPGKRPLSSMSPTIVERDGMFELAVGGSGGSKIISSVLNVLLNYLDNGHDLLDAVATPRVHHQLLPNKVDIETGIDQQIVKSLRKRGHEIYQLGKGDTISAVEMVGRAADGTVQAASDPRKFALGSAY